MDGQVHGGLASGIAQALWEQVLYDADGNPITSTLAEYAIPSAAELPSFTTAHTETPSPVNDLGAKGIGESATVGSTPAVQNAVVDALSHLGVRHIDIPCTPERVWRAIRAAREGTLPDPSARAAGRNGRVPQGRRSGRRPRARSRKREPLITAPPSAGGVPFARPATPDDVRRGLEGCGYLADEGLSTAVYLAMTLRRPLFLEGEPGAGKPRWPMRCHGGQAESWYVSSATRA